MDALQQMIDNEVFRRAGGGQGYGQAGVGGGISSARKGVSSSPRGIDVLMNAASLIPRIGTAAKVLNAGPVADGTLEHARRMGWMR